ncbi:MAG: dihydrofolate reductase family protein [Pseudomonadota bacterium]
MSKLIYITNTSLDGYIEDAAGNFDWPSSAETYRFFTQLLSQMGTLIYGRRLYEKMAYWGSPVESYPQEHRAFAEVWQRPSKWVYSRTLSVVTTPNTRLNPEFEVEPLRDLKRTSNEDISIGGAELATAALQANLVDELHVVVHPLIVGGGKSAFKGSQRRNFSLIESRRFDAGSVYLRYHIPSDSPVVPRRGELDSLDGRDSERD